jgi:AmmeMemoRadiSam system protein B/AmmeMemoRadiSam system protein A
MVEVFEEMTSVRAPVLAGTWYPNDPAVLSRDVDGYLAQAENRIDSARLKAVIAPHAGYRFSGTVAGSAYAAIAPLRERIRRVVLIGPSHRVAFDGIATTSAEVYRSPLGDIPIDGAGVRDILRLPQVSERDEAHDREHCLEIHLPFLQRALGSFTLVPLVGGRARPGEVAEVLANLWGDEETLIVVSSDLSHYLDYETCRALDARTSQAILAGRIEEIGDDQACGRVGIKGLLKLANTFAMTTNLLDLRNSGDTSGAKDRVVGYGSWSCHLPARGINPRRLLAIGHGRLILGMAQSAIRQGLKTGKPAGVVSERVPEALKAEGACFVTLTLDNRLRGCIGSVFTHRGLAEDIVMNAHKAAFADPRFSPLSQEEFDRVAIDVSLLGPHVAFPVESEDALVAGLRPGRDGLVLSDEGKRALFLPAVWESIPEPRQFVRRLKQKAGWPADYWSQTMTVTRFDSEKISAASIRAFVEG